MTFIITRNVLMLWLAAHAVVANTANSMPSAEEIKKIAAMATFDPQQIQPCTGNACEEKAAINTATDDCTGFGCRDPVEEKTESSIFDDIGCTPVSLDLTLDSRPQDINFQLKCNDNAMVWNYPSQLIPARGAHDKISVSACVFLADSCCEFQLHDSHGDGLSAGDYAEMSLQVDGDAVLTYNTLDSPPFTMLAHYFGDKCNDVGSSEQPVNKNTPMTTHVSTLQDCEAGVERPLSFRIVLDEHPEEVSWYLVCDNEEKKRDTVWDIARGSLSGHAGQVAQEHACIPYEATCAFTIVDSAGDGGSSYTLSLGVLPIDLHMALEPFDVKTYCIGKNCGGKNVSEQKDPNQSTMVENTREAAMNVHDSQQHAAEEERAREEQRQEEQQKLRDQEQQHKELDERLKELQEEIKEAEVLGSDNPRQQEEEARLKLLFRSSSSDGSDSSDSLTTEEAFTKEFISATEDDVEDGRTWLYAVFSVCGVMIIVASVVGCVTGQAKRKSRAVESALDPVKDDDTASDDASTVPSDGDSNV